MPLPPQEEDNSTDVGDYVWVKLIQRAKWSDPRWEVGCRLASVGHVAPAGILHGVVAPPNTVGTDFLAYWTHCCFGSVPLSGLSPVRSRTLSLSPPFARGTALRRSGAAEATTELLLSF
ncbi:hypothetical protein D4764_09G0010470 [Takifugu flavidus]|uniref:Uncharacterized protein n=1 Tax=Takifugu flavidus TaxID=433684 RepID=A0A5C6MRJ7_9TELE|nr:hypothetical protein D4764_09G0010470 [Takifugu flavidus]